MMKVTSTDSFLKPYSRIIEKRYRKYLSVKAKLTEGASLKDFALGHLYYGVHKIGGSWIFREWAPNAEAVYLVSDITGWKPDERFCFKKPAGKDRTEPEAEDWELTVPENMLSHGSIYKLFIKWPGGSGERLPAYAERVIQDDNTKIFSAQLWDPPAKYKWKNSFAFEKNKPLVIYETHVGMAGEAKRVGTYTEFKNNILPRIIDTGYNTIQMMALMEHPYYGSFGYQVSNFFALSSRFGTPEEFKELVDECHGAGIGVVMDLVHSHSVRNELEGLGKFDGTDYQYFHTGVRGIHPAWDSRLFNYGKERVLHYLLSNCAYWLTEYNIDGFRFDGVTSMLYHDHGLARSFTGYDDYFSENFHEEAAVYLALANELTHQLKPHAVTAAEDMSGYPGTAYDIDGGGLGFDFRLAMGVPDFWIKIIKEKKDEEWNAEEIWFELNNRRRNEKSIAYCESHDQALVGDKTLSFLLMDSHMYTSMDIYSKDIVVDRGIALHKIIKLLTFSIGGEAYLTFMGNEFGHPEWIDFPRAGNNWSYDFARRQWSLLDNRELRYFMLHAFEKRMIAVCSDVLLKEHAERLKIDNNDMVISWKRGDLYFTVNLNPSVSFKDYGIEVMEGEYSLVLNSDSLSFNGFGRVPDQLILKTVRHGHNKNFITPYLPSRTALVFKKN